MEDDIDIEEHDILQNPRIQNILPHFQIKTEPVDYDDVQYEDATETYEEFESLGYDDEEMEDSYQDDYSEMSFEQPSSEIDRSSDYYPRNNIIILGSKPCPGKSSSVLTLGSKPVSAPKSHSVIIGETRSLEPLKCKPCPKSRKPGYSQDSSILQSLLVQESESKPERVPGDAIVYLEDWGTKLDNSSCYCKECQTLFATRNALDAHNMIAHSFLVAIDSPERPITPDVVETTETDRFYNPSESSFPDNISLVPKDETTAVAKMEKVYYRCDVCTSYYSSFLRFTQHTQKMHGVVFKDSALVPFRNQCAFCIRTMRTGDVSEYNKHIWNSHRKLKENDKKNVVASESREANLKVGKKLTKTTIGFFTKKGKKHSNNMSSQYKCVKCKSMYASKDSVVRHIKALHPSDKRFIEIGVKVKGVQKKHGNQYTHFMSLVPKSVVYECSTCNLNVLCALSMRIHNCNAGYYTTQQCNVCSKRINRKDERIHLIQHKLSTKIKTIKFSSNIYNSILCKCSDCNVYYKEKQFWHHRFVGCSGDVKPAWCVVCKVKVDNLLEHKEMHSKKTPSKTDFYFINEFFAPGRDETQTPGLPVTKKMKIEGSASSDSLKKKIKTEETASSNKLKRKLPLNETTVKKAKRNGVALFYCAACNAYTNTLKRSRFHVSQNCLLSKTKAANCPQCGLRFKNAKPMRTHLQGHLKYKWKFKDYEFLSVVTKEPVMPPLPTFPVCKRCKCRFMGYKHNCKKPQKRCTVCQTNFDEAAYPLHKLHHKYMKSDIDDVAELLQKYESLKSIWNIVYQCSECDVAMDSYDRAVGHSQRHLASGPQVPTLNCEACSVRFEEISFSNHKALHTNENVRKSSFDFLTFVPSNLLSDEWFNLFGSLSEVAVKQITSGSVYVTRNVRMSVILDGPPEFTIYKCDHCRHYVDAEDVFSHTHSCDGHALPHPCLTCGIPCASNQILKKHKRIHKNTTITANSYRIVSFNAKGDKNFNASLKEVGSKVKVDAASAKSSKGAKKFRWYQCQKCKSCSPRDAFVIKHKCLTRGESAPCDLCPYVSSPKYLSLHKKWHEDNKHVTSFDCEIVPFNRGVVTATNPWYQCQECKILFHNKNATHVCEATNLAPACSRCKYKFYYESYLLHLNDHAGVPNLTKNDINIVPLPVPSESKVTQGKSALKQDSISAKPLKRRAYVDSSDLDGPSDSHSSSRTDKASNSVVVKTETRKNVKVKQEYKKRVYTLRGIDYTSELHGCWCGLYLLTLGALGDHIKRGNHGTMDRQACKQCNFVFSAKSMIIHQNVHHDIMKLKAEDFSVNVISNVILERKNNAKGKAHPKNTIYECGSCGMCLFTFKYAKKHYINCANDHKLVTCKVCGLKFKDIHLNVHRNRYHKIGKYKKDDIHIFLVKEAPETKANKIDKDDGKVTVKKPNRKLHKCSVCGLHYLRKLSLKQHALGKHDEVKKNCTICSLVFTPDELEQHTSIHHTQINLTIEDFDIITPNDECNDQSDESHAVPKQEVSIKKEEEESKPFIRPPAKKNVDKSRETVVLLKCADCHVHISGVSNMRRHLSMVVHSKSPLVDCDKCGLKFPVKSLKCHEKLHRPGVTMYSCCMREEYFLCNRTGHTFKCDLCDFNVPTLVELVDHLIDKAHDSSDSELHHKTPESNLGNDKIYTPIITKVIEITDGTANLVNKKDSTDSQMADNDMTAESYETVHEVSQMEVSDEVNNTKTDNVSDESVVSQSSDAEANSKKLIKKSETIKLYKCAECNVYFLNQNTCYKHSINHKPMNVMEYIQCKLCSFQFRYISLSKHVRSHHYRNFDLNYVLVEEYHPKKEGEKTTKIDIYFAIDKVQSRLVSTTTDEKAIDSRIEDNLVAPTDEVSSEIIMDKSDERPHKCSDEVTTDNCTDNETINSILMRQEGSKTDASVLEEDNNISTSNNKDSVSIDSSIKINLPASSNTLERDSNTNASLGNTCASEKEDKMSVDTIRIRIDENDVEIYEETPLCIEILD